MSSLVLILVALTTSPQDGAVPYTAELYAPPAVRPFEPPSNFGRVVEEGDGESDPRRRPLIAPVAVEDYSRSYEFTPSGADTAYDRGVANAEAVMDARMGALDGLWKVRDAEGRPILSLALVDKGEGRPLDGAFRRIDAAGVLGALDEAERAGDVLTLRLAGATLSLTPTAEGWTGALTEAGRVQSVTMSR